MAILRPQLPVIQSDYYLYDMRKKTTQKQLALYKLIQCHKENPMRFVPAWEFGGEIFVKATGKWELMSYKCPARLSDIILENPDIVERETIIGRSGAAYFGYRLSGKINPKQIVDPHLRDFYNFIVLNEQEVPRESEVETKNEVVSVGQFDFNFKPTVDQNDLFMKIVRENNERNERVRMIIVKSLNHEKLTAEEESLLELYAKDDVKSYD